MAQTTTNGFERPSLRDVTLKEKLAAAKKAELPPDFGKARPLPPDKIDLS